MKIVIRAEIEIGDSDLDEAERAGMIALAPLLEEYTEVRMEVSIDPLPITEGFAVDYVE